MTHRTARGKRACAVRATFLTGFVFLLLAALAARFFDLMVLRHAQAHARATGQIRRTEVITAWRGTIRDRRGRPLALTRALPSVFVDPALVEPSDREALARQLSRDLEVELPKVRDHLARDARFRWIRRRIHDPRIADRIPYLTQHPAVSVREELARCYPHGTVGAHFIGFALADGGAGGAGAELAFNGKLKARCGSRVVLRDGTRAGRRISTGSQEKLEACRNGEDVSLTMDLTIQTFAEQALEAACAEWEPEKGVAIVLDPRNGDVLAMACRPTYDPREYGRYPKRHTIPAVADAYPVGSTMKPLVIAAALDQGFASVDESIDCENGLWRIGGRLLHDTHEYGMLSLPDIVVRSSNIGTAKIARRMGSEKVRKLLCHLGFGRSTRSGLPGEACGLLPKDPWRKDYTLVSVGMGQGFTATPMQFAAAFATLASGGVYRRPRVSLDREEEPLRQVYSREVADGLMKPILERVVSEGTGRPASVPGHRVAGKTGTAEVIHRTGPTGDYVSSFVGFAPAEAPRFLVYVTMSKPRTNECTPYGSRCAAPAVAEILDRCLRYAEVSPSHPSAADRPGRRRSTGEPPAATPGRTARELDLLQQRLRNLNR